MRRARESATVTYATQSAHAPAQEKWTYDDYALLPDDGKRYEVIRGELYMSAAPRPLHQRVITRLAFFLEGFLEESALGTAYVAPIDVILPGKPGDPVRPDILFVRQERMEIVGETRIEGAPDLAIEALSPSNLAHDRSLKYELYAQAGVPEYWIIDPHGQTAAIHLLRGGTYESLGLRNRGETARSEVLDGFVVPVEEIIPA